MPDVQCHADKLLSFSFLAQYLQSYPLSVLILCIQKVCRRALTRNKGQLSDFSYMDTYNLRQHHLMPDICPTYRTVDNPSPMRKVLHSMNSHGLDSAHGIFK